MSHQIQLVPFDKTNHLQKDRQIWAGYQPPIAETEADNVGGTRSEFTVLHSENIAQDGRVPSDDSSFEANLDGDGYREMRLKYKNGEWSSAARFLAPLFFFDKLHKGACECVDVGSEGLAVSTGGNGHLLVWNSATGEILRELEGHCMNVYCCRFYPSGLVVLSGGADMQLRVFSVETSQCVRTLVGHTQGITDVGFVGKGKRVVSCSKDGSWRLWDTGSAQCIHTGPVEDGPLNTLALAASSLANGMASGEGEAEETTGKLIVVGTSKGSLRGFDLASKDQVVNCSMRGSVETVSFWKDNQVVAGTEQGQVAVFDLRNTKDAVLDVSERMRGCVHRVKPYKDGYFAAFGDGTVSFSPHALKSDQSDITVELSGPDCDPVYDFSLTDKHIFTCCRDGIVRKYMLPK